MEANGAGKRVAGFAFVQFRRGLAAQGRILQPVDVNRVRSIRPTSRSAKAVQTICL
jgi:hypothetical protein